MTYLERAQDLYARMEEGNIMAAYMHGEGVRCECDNDRELMGAAGCTAPPDSSHRRTHRLG